jgi:hypothetical protein
MIYLIFLKFTMGHKMKKVENHCCKGFVVWASPWTDNFSTPKFHTECEPMMKKNFQLVYPV